MSSEVLQSSLLRKWGQSDVDPKELLEHLQFPNSTLSQASGSLIFRPFTQPFLTRKIKLATNIRNSFIHKNGNRIYKGRRTVR